MTPYEQGYYRLLKLAGLYKTETKKRTETPYKTKQAVHAPPGSSRHDEPTMAADPQDVHGEKPFSREDVQYQDSSPHPDESCARCHFYQGDGTCAIVMGAIYPYGWCNRFQEEQGPTVAKEGMMMVMPMPRTPDKPGWYVDAPQQTHPLVPALMSVPFGLIGATFGGLAGGLVGGPPGALAGAGLGGLGGAALPWAASGEYMEEKRMDPEEVQALLQSAGGSAAEQMAAYLQRPAGEQQGFSRVVTPPGASGATHVRHVPGAAD